MLQNGELWALLGLSLASEFLSNGVCYVLISDHKQETNRTDKTDSECTTLLIVKFICKINELLS